MSGIEILKTEHQTISTALDLLSSICRRLDQKEPVKATHLKQLVQFFQLYADRCHHAKEEEVLFELLHGSNSQLDRMLNSLCTQHVMARLLVGGMEESAVNYARGQMRATKSFREQARAYLTLLRIHICDEEHVLFPLASKQLSSSQRVKVTRKFRALDTKLAEEPSLLRCQETVQKLSKIYGVERTGCLQTCR